MVFGDAALYLEGQYGKPLPPELLEHPDKPNTAVYFLDFSVPRQQLLEFRQEFGLVQVVDHHKTAEADLLGLDDVVFDMQESGASLTWKFFFPDLPAPELVRYVRDRDLWEWRLPDSKAVSAYIFLQERTPEAWYDMLEALENDPSLIVRAGKLLLQQTDQMVESAAKASQSGTFAGVRAQIVNTGALQSEVGNVLALKEGNPLAVCWSVGSTGQVSISFRSTDQGPDASEVAKRFGGGGHRNAAGARLSLPDFLAQCCFDPPVA
jgi:oligoribonuclease NrnB/cAMP/cGMP phosphodiesterase (DHH superfamily)